jgi:hypothetical protein
MGQVGREAEFSGPIQNLQSGLAGMVVCAVRYEPVSKDNSLLTGKLTGYFAISGLLEAIFR